MDGGLDGERAAPVNVERLQVPEYLIKTYSWAYLKPLSLLLLDNPVVLSIILWGNLPRLVECACEEFEPGQRVMQAANAYGPLAQELARVVGPTGALEVIDIAPLQVEHCARKLAEFPHATARHADATAPGGGPYDGVCCFFLLHEVPDDYKRAVVDALLAAVPKGGKVVFVDYHRSTAWHPLRGVMHLIFRWLEPFAFGLLEREIQTFASAADAFRWDKQTYFGGLYQKVVATRTA